MFVQTGFEPLIEKKIIWNIGRFNYFGGNINRFVNQEFEVDIEGVGDVPQTKWKFDIRYDFESSYCLYRHEDILTEHMRFRYTSLNAGITRSEVGRTFHIVRASLIDSNGKGKWKSFQTELKDLMDPRFDGQPIIIVDFLKESKFADLPLQANGSLMIEIDFEICGKKCFGQARVTPKLAALTISKEGSPTGVGRFLNTKEHSDVKIVAMDGKEFHAHKIILRSNCEVFDAMFRSEMTESQTGVVKLDDISSDGVNFLLHFIYNHSILPFTVDGNTVKGKAGESEDAGVSNKAIDVDEVLYIASKYRLEPVMEFVDSKFRDLCSKKNAIYLLRMCKKYSLNCLNVIKAFIKSQDRIIDELMSKDFQD